MRICAGCGGHIAETKRRDAKYCCKECGVRAGARAYYLRNMELCKARAAEWRKNNPCQAEAHIKKYWARNKTRRTEYVREWRRANPERANETQRKWRGDNPDKVALYWETAKKNDPDGVRRRRREWARRHPEMVANRAAAKIQAMPPWLTDDQKRDIREIYLWAASLTKIMGVQYSVDHIVPLRGKNVRGLHVPWNLQIMTKSANSRKGAKVQDLAMANQTWQP